MASGIQHWPAEKFNGLYREQCTTSHGRALAEIIDRNEHAMIQASLLGHPALSPILPLLSKDLEKELENAPLMQAFGHMAKLEMEFLGFTESGKKETHWPFSDNRKTSTLAVFSR
ncbi:hypothetical protein [Roseibium sp. RKSG952]|uniref:hypothetical protein n=1 Tax=Roseibium sp. RKSG952 TaxID=2529384 RepID=UPI0012BC37F4|nr:hypothetical protein [Roseibium sp. RKSG952]MTH96993.1 hypothetical protein [Roseibium sp. RKSG952]